VGLFILNPGSETYGSLFVVGHEKVTNEESGHFGG